MNDPIFICGTQRSGTTWLANIFDASPETLLFMEPFAPAYRILPEFPDASYFLASSSPYLDHLLQVEMPARLLRYKSFLFRKSIISPRWFRIERWLTKRGRRFLPCALQNRIMKFELLNLNRTDPSFPLYLKNSDPSAWVIKELRLAGKIPVLLHAFPTAHFIVIMRHPCATVHSILNWFERGRLGELRQDLQVYFEKVDVQAVSNPYKSLIDLCRKGDLAHQVALYWRISYEMMYKQLEGNPLADFLVYEELASQPMKTAERILVRSGIPWSQSVSEYVFKSSSKQGDNLGPITTVRESRSYYRAWTLNVTDAIRQSVLDIVGDSFLMEHFKPYYEP